MNDFTICGFMFCDECGEFVPSTHYNYDEGMCQFCFGDLMKEIEDEEDE